MHQLCPPTGIPLLRSTATAIAAFRAGVISVSTPALHGNHILYCATPLMVQQPVYAGWPPSDVLPYS